MKTITLDIPSGWKVRMDTNDLEIYRCVVVEDEYKLAEVKLEPADVVVDVGAHIGWFALAAARRGAGIVVCAEPFAENFELLESNLRHVSSTTLALSAAIWRSDERELTDGICYRPSSDPANTGGGDVLGRVGKGLQWIPLDAVLRWYGQVKILKLDCEYSEFPILFTSKELRRAERIVGEYHEIGPGTAHPEAIPEWVRVGGRESYTRTDLRAFLESCGYEVEIHHEAENIGKFFAIRR